MVNDELVLTPGGWRSKSKVHYVKSGHHVEVQDKKLKIVETTTGNVIKDIIDLSKIPNESRIKTEVKKGISGTAPITNGWIANAEWTNDNGVPISYFGTSWIVPPAPSNEDNQTIFLFNGIQQNPSGPFILQPVLQWGPSFAGGGNYWCIANWYVDGQGGVALFSDLVQVNTGDIVTGTMTLTGQSGTSFNYLSSFDGYPTTNLTVNNIEELKWANITLECYNINNCDDYPNAQFTEFDNIEIKIGDSEAIFNWQADDRVTDCGQLCQIINNASPGGVVRLLYGTA